jgi:3-methyladenine DNA glycosylase Tag
MADNNLKKILALREQKAITIEEPGTKRKVLSEEENAKFLKELGKKAANFDEDLLTFMTEKASGENEMGVEWVLSNRNAEAMKERTTIAISANASVTLKRLAGFSENLTPSLIIDNILLEWVTKNKTKIKRIESEKVQKGYF